MKSVLQVTGSSWVVLGHGMRAFGRPRKIDVEVVADKFGVSASTPRRWVRDHIPDQRWSRISRMIHVPAKLLERESVLLQLAENNVGTLGLGRVNVSEWEQRGLLEPHLLVVRWYPGMGVWIPSVTTREGLRASVSKKNISRLLLDVQSCENKFDAEVRRLELLRSSAEYRIRVWDPKRVKKTGQGVAGVSNWSRVLGGASAAVVETAPAYEDRVLEWIKAEVRN